MKFQMSKEQKIRMTQFTKIDQHTLFKHVIFIDKSNIQCFSWFIKIKICFLELFKVLTFNCRLARFYFSSENYSISG